MSKIYIDIRPNGTYRVRVRVNIDGEIISTSATYWPDPSLTSEQNRRAAEKRGYKLIEEVKAKHRAELEGKEITFKKYYESRYLEKAKTFFAATTFAFYVNVIEKLFLPMFEDVKLKDITAVMVQDAIQTLTNKANENDDCEDPEYIKPQTVKRYITAFRSVINFALEDGTLDKNPLMGGLRYRKFEPTNVVCLDEEDFKKILLDLQLKVRLPVLQLERNDVMVAIGLFAGLRRGESVALRWRDILNLSAESCDKVKINVNHSAFKAPGEKQKIAATKTSCSTRLFTVPKILGEVLWSWRNTLLRRNLPAGEDDFVISDESGGMVSVYSPTKWFKQYLEEHHLKDVKLHSLRHTFASMMLATGMDLCTLRDIMGHKEISTTEIYLRSFKLNGASLMDPINAYTTSFLTVKEDEDEI